MMPCESYCVSAEANVAPSMIIPCNLLSTLLLLFHATLAFRFGFLLKYLSRFLCQSKKAIFEKLFGNISIYSVCFIALILTVLFGISLMHWVKAVKLFAVLHLMTCSHKHCFANSFSGLFVWQNSLILYYLKGPIQTLVCIQVQANLTVLIQTLQLFIGLFLLHKPLTLM